MPDTCSRHKNISASLLLPAFALLGACSWSEPPPESGPMTERVDRAPVREASRRAPESDRIQTVISKAQEQLGRPYRYGGSSPSGFDCSGLVHYAYSFAGVSTPRTTSAMWKELPKLDRSSLRPGDVLFFNIGGKPSHVGLYVGNDEFVHAPATGRTVSRARLSSPFYNKTFVGAGRVISY